MHEDLFRKCPMPMMVWRLDDLEDAMSFRLMDANEAAYNATHFEFSGRIGKPIREAFPLLQDGWMQKAFDALKTGEVAHLGDVDYGDRDIEWQIFRLTITPVDESTLIASYENVTALRNLEHAVRNYVKTHPGAKVIPSTVLFKPKLDLLEDSGTDLTLRRRDIVTLAAMTAVLIGIVFGMGFLLMFR